MADSRSAEMVLCPHCGQANACAVALGQAAQSCWCMRMPVVRAVALTVDLNGQSDVKEGDVDNQPACWCQHCLQALMAPAPE